MILLLCSSQTDKPANSNSYRDSILEIMDHIQD